MFTFFPEKEYLYNVTKDNKDKNLEGKSIESERSGKNVDGKFKDLINTNLILKDMEQKVQNLVITSGRKLWGENIYVANEQLKIWSSDLVIII